MDRECPGHGCTTRIAPGLLLCSECRLLEAHVAAVTQSNFEKLQSFLAANDAFEAWLREHEV